MIFDRIKSLDAILATAEKKSLTRSLGAFQLTMLGIGAVIGTGIFVLTAEAAQKAGPGMMISFIIAGFVCAVAALCYAEMAAMVPVSGSAYTYSYAVMGELLAWMVGWALILEYAVAAGAVSVGWSGYMIGYVENAFAIDIPSTLVLGPFDGGLINLPAMLIAGLVTWLLMIGTKESATINSSLVSIKIIALTAFVILALPVMNMKNFEPFSPLGFGGIGMHHGDHIAHVNAVFLCPPAIIIRNHADDGVRQLGLPRELGFGHGGHSNDVCAPTTIQSAFSAG